MLQFTCYPAFHDDHQTVLPEFGAAWGLESLVGHVTLPFFSPLGSFRCLGWGIRKCKTELTGSSETRDDFNCTGLRSDKISSD